MRLLPVVAIYGANASGKSNLFKALSFAKDLVVEGTPTGGTIPVEPFRLGKEGDSGASSFRFEIMVDQTVYEFGFVADSKAVREEWLLEVSSASERQLYRRMNGEIEFGANLKRDEFLGFAFRGTRDNQLFLTNSVSQKVDRFRPVYDWFSETLTLIAPDARFGPIDQFIEEDSPLYHKMDDMLARLDTGIVRLDGKVVEFESLRLTESARRRVQDAVKHGATVRITGHPTNDQYTVDQEGDKIILKRLVTQHRREDGSLAEFEMAQESDGTIRIIDLLPAFLDLTAEKAHRVYVIDELDRSLHSLLTRQLIESYLSTCNARTRGQLLFTTHDVLLMDQKLLRRDEMWVVDRSVAGRSELTSFSDYKDVRYDKDIRKSYLLGRLGGVPRLLLAGAISPSSRQDSEIK